MPGSIRQNPNVQVIGGSIRGFEAWSANRLQNLPLSVLKDTVLGIDVSNYVERLMRMSPTKEPLLPALGGFPFGLRTHILNDLEQLQQANITPLFVFSGLKIVQTGRPVVSADEAFEHRQQAWKLYDESQPTEAVQAFGAAISLPPQAMYKYIMQILDEKNVDYQVAPYHAWAQLVYLERHPKQYIDAIFGPAELFLADVEKVITGIGKGTFSCLSKKAIMQDLGGLSHEQFIDVCILSGSDFCDTFPTIDNNPLFAFKSSLELMKTYRNIDNILTQYKDNAAVKKSNFLEKYRKAKFAIRHHVHLTDEGFVEPMQVGDCPGDVYNFVGSRLPDEVYFYLSRGVIGPSVLDTLLTQEIREVLPLDNGDTEDYRRLVESLSSVRTQSLALLTQPLHRFWQSQTVDVIFWYDKGKPRKLIPKDLLPSPHETIMNWNSREADFGPLLEKAPHGPTLGFAVSLLSDPELAAKTIRPKDHENLLTTTNEIIMNTLWRTLQLRSFVNAEHKLTPWGKALNAAMEVLNPSDKLEEACYLGIELIRIRAIKPDNTGPSSLVSRVACLGSLGHHGIGYTGPLSRSLLSFNSLVRPMAQSIKNLTEMVLVSLLLNGDENKQDRQDWSKLGLRIPFIQELNVGLGLAVKTYLDELATQQDPTSYEAIYAPLLRELLPRMISQANDLETDIKKAFRLWDALIVGIKSVQKDNLVPDAAKFMEADAWLKARRPKELEPNTTPS